MDAGVKSGDVITAFDGVAVADTRELVRRVGATEVGKAVDIEVFRNGKTELLKITLGRRELAEGETPVPAAAEKPAEPVISELLGLTLSPVTPEIATELSLDPDQQGLVVSKVDEMSEAFEKGLRVGDLITEAGQQKVTSAADLEARVADAKEAGRKSVLLLIRREGEPRFVALSVE